VAIAVIVSLMMVTLLLAAGLLALERSEHVYARLVRGLVTPTRLLSEKIALSAACAGVIALIMAAPGGAGVGVHGARAPGG
jgi:ABC-2 type transport system permease protein